VRGRTRRARRGTRRSRRLGLTLVYEEISATVVEPGAGWSPLGDTWQVVVRDTSDAPDSCAETWAPIAESWMQSSTFFSREWQVTVGWRDGAPEPVLADAGSSWVLTFDERFWIAAGLRSEEPPQMPPAAWGNVRRSW
jgi:hypothetical protein